MPKIVLEFNLPEEEDEFQLAYNGANQAIVLEMMDNYLRSILKYDENLSEHDTEIYKAVRDKLVQLTAQYGSKV